ncbi:MAG: transposase, partial [Nanoarchaeota archaeon]
MVKEYEDYLSFIDDALEIAKKVPRYFSKFSNKIYCNHQKFAIYILMQKLKLTTRGVVSWLRSNSDARLLMGLHRVPVHTTIVRFVKKIRKQISLILDIRQADTVAIDATGFELEAKSFYYRINRAPEYMRKTKKYMKLSIVIDTDKQLILKYKINKKAGRDNFRYVRELIKDLKIKYLIGDKGYDSKQTRRFVITKLKAIPVIPAAWHTNFYGYLHKSKKITGENYHQRS